MGVCAAALVQVQEFGALAMVVTMNIRQVGAFRGAMARSEGKSSPIKSPTRTTNLHGVGRDGK